MSIQTTKMKVKDVKRKKWKRMALVAIYLFCVSLILHMAVENMQSIPEFSGRRGGGTPWTGIQSIAGHTYTPIHTIPLSLDWGKKLENP